LGDDNCGSGSTYNSTVGQCIDCPTLVPDAVCNFVYDATHPLNIFWHWATLAEIWVRKVLTPIVPIAEEILQLTLVIFAAIMSFMVIAVVGGIAAFGNLF
jgi:hypothetical protein